MAIVATHAGFASGRTAEHDLPAAILGRLDWGVAVFFVLSGFLLYRPFALHAFGSAAAPRALEFWWRRSLRIFPALWLVVVVTLAVISTRPTSLSNWWHYLLLVHVYDHNEVDPNLTQLWTLSAEILFYAILPVLGWLAAYRVRDAYERQLVIVGGLVAIAFAFNALQHEMLSHNQAQLWLPAYLDWFGLGVLLAVLSAGRPVRSMTTRFDAGIRAWATAPITCWVLAAILWSLTLTQAGTPRVVVLASFWQWTAQHVLFGAAAFFLILPLVLRPPAVADRVLGSRVGRYLGEVSYGVYLWHLGLLLLIQRLLDYPVFSGHFWMLFVLGTVASLLVASVSWYGLERPVLRYGSRPWRPRAASVAATSTSSTAPRISS